METKQLTCKERVGEMYNDTFETIRRMLSGEDEDGEERDPFEMLDEYGLGIDYIEPHTFNDQEVGYLRWQLSWGGPSDEFRFYIDVDKEPYKIEYWFMDWFDGAHVLVQKEDDQDTLRECWCMLGMEFAMENK